VRHGLGDQSQLLQGDAQVPHPLVG
jgi:hypothetical protein